MNAAMRTVTRMEEKGELEENNNFYCINLLKSMELDDEEEEQMEETLDSEMKDQEMSCLPEEWV
jgi:hypothetical protein